MPDRALLLVAVFPAEAHAIRTVLDGSALPFTITEAAADFEVASLPAERYAAVLVCCSTVTPAGLDLVRRCRNLAGSPPVLVITDPAAEARAVDFVKAGADDWVSSAPDGLAALGRALDNALARHGAERDGENRYRREVERRLEHTDTLLTLAREVGSTVELQEVLRRTTRRLVRVLRADVGGAWVQAPDGRFVPYAGYRVPPDSLPSFLAYPVPADHPIVAAVSRLSGPFISVDSQADPLFALAVFRTVPHRSVVIVPMWAKHGPIGVFALVWTRGRCDFDDDQIRLADGVARYAASALENARLFADNDRLYQAELRRREEADALVAMTRMLARATAVDAACRHVADSVQTLFSASACQVLLLQPDGSFAVTATTGSGAPADPTLAVSLRAEGQEVGQLVVHGKQSRGEADMTVLQAFADAAGLALERARFVEALADRAREARLVAELARAVHTTLEPTMVMIHLAETARRLCRADLGGVARRDPLTGVATFCHPFPADAPVRVEPGKGLGGLAMTTGRAMRSDNYPEDPRANDDNRRLIAGLSVVSVMAVPVKLGERVEALIFLGNVRRRPFTDLDEVRVLRLAEHAAVAIRNVELIAAERRARTELEVSTEALRQSEERYRQLVENATDAVFTLDLEGNITSTNDAGVRLTGYARDEIVRMNMAQVLAPEFLPRATESLAAVGTGRTIAVFECEILTKHGHRVTIEIQGAPRWQDGRVVGIQGIGRDVTERRRLEEQLRQAQKMDAIGRLAGGVAHDFNNLLTVIQGRADLLLAQMAPGDRLREPLELIHRTAGRAADLTQRLLAFGRRQVLRPRVLDLGAVLHDLAPMLRSLVREDIELSLEMAPGIVRVRADPGQLEQVVVNLVVNARDAMPRGGRVSIALAVTADGDPGRPSAERQRPQAALRFSDTGDGMDAETRARVFEPFFTTKDVGKGTGLGLATVYGIVTQSGGRVTVESDLGRGTTFTVLLPIVDDEPSTAPDTDERREPSRGKGRILIVEDEPEVLALAADILQARGYTVVSAGGPEEALAWMAQHPGSMDLLLTDVVMPRMSGPELATRIEAMCPGVRVVYMSGYAADASGHHSVFDFGAGFVQKPFTSEDLSRKIRDALARETP